MQATVLVEIHTSDADRAYNIEHYSTGKYWSITLQLRNYNFHKVTVISGYITPRPPKRRKTGGQRFDALKFRRFGGTLAQTSF